MNTNLPTGLFNVNVLYQDNEIIVVEKPEGLPVHNKITDKK
jgi:23S rRNA-/tRNA-specific pseudouridylate synthase